MDIVNRLGTSGPDLTVVLIAGLAIYLWVIASSRLVGLRSFAKMSAFDFAMTVAIGSIIAATATGTAPLADGAAAVAVLFFGQYLVARLRRRGILNRAVDNTPLLLFYRGDFLEDHLRRARVTRADVRAKLREANVLQFDQVDAVVFETTGDVSVLHGDGPFDPRLLEGVDCGPVDPGTQVA